MDLKRSLMLLLALGIILTAAPAAATDGADVGVAMRWDGNGTPRVRAGETTTYQIVVKNDGPDVATGLMINTIISDHFNEVSLTCSTAAACAWPGTTLEPGASFTATLTVVVCCFPPGETRTASVDALLEWSGPSPDPDATNDEVTLLTRIIGPHTH